MEIGDLAFLGIGGRLENEIRVPTQPLLRSFIGTDDRLHDARDRRSQFAQANQFEIRTFPVLARPAEEWIGDRLRGEEPAEDFELMIDRDAACGPANFYARSN